MAANPIPPPAPVPPDTVARIERELANGAVVIGESHNKQDARLAIKVLITRQAVTRLSIELPVPPPSVAPAPGGHVSARVNDYFLAINTLGNQFITLQELTDFALAHHVPVYFHDMPAKLTRLRALEAPGAYLTHAQQFGQLTARAEHNLTNQLGPRNTFTAGYLQAQLPAGPGATAGLLILAGDDHLDAQQCGGPATTIQGLLGIPNGRVFHLA